MRCRQMAAAPVWGLVHPAQTGFTQTPTGPRPRQPTRSRCDCYPTGEISLATAWESGILMEQMGRRHNSCSVKRVGAVLLLLTTCAALSTSTVPALAKA